MGCEGCEFSAGEVKDMGYCDEIAFWIKEFLLFDDGGCIAFFFTTWLVHKRSSRPDVPKSLPHWHSS